MPVSHKNKFIFIHIPKTGGDSIDECLDLKNNNELFGFEDLYGNKYNIKDGLDILEKNKDKKLICLQHLTALQIKNKINKNIWDNYFKFAFIRNPWDKVVSHYFYVIQKRKDIQKAINIDKKTTFNEFVHIIKRTKRIEQQKNYIYDNQDKILIDFIGRFEKLESDFRKICKKINIESSLKKINSSNHKNYKEYYTNKTKNIVKDLFINDIELFKYKF